MIELCLCLILIGCTLYDAGEGETLDAPPEPGRARRG